MTRQILSPDASVSGPMVVSLQSATTKIKELITQSIMSGLSQDELTKQLNKVIAEACAKVKDEKLREEIRNGFVISAKKWHYELSQTMKVLTQNLKNSLIKFAPVGSLYAVDLNAMFTGNPSQVVED